MEDAVSFVLVAIPEPKRELQHSVRVTRMAQPFQLRFEVR